MPIRHAVYLAALVLGSATTLIGADDRFRTYHFDNKDVGRVPAGWKADRTGTGEGSVWKVMADKTAPSKTGFVLAQTAESPNAMFNLCVAEGGANQDVDVSVAFKAIRGKNDQGGGIVWRFQNAKNYYVCRMNPLEDNYRVYKVVDGKRTQLETKEGLKIPAEEWHTLRAKHVGEKIECYLDGKKSLEARDDTFSKAGNVGLWTKSDAQTYFDDFKVSGK